MRLKTTIANLNGSLYVLVPANMAKYFKMKDIKENGECQIEDITENKAEITFKMW